MSSAKELFTIGHSNHSIEAFIALLQRHGISAVADVRSPPYLKKSGISGKPPYFNRGMKDDTPQFIATSNSLPLGREHFLESLTLLYITGKVMNNYKNLVA